MKADPLLEIDRQILAEADADEVRRNLLALCDGIGPRFAGTEGYRLAAEYMRGRFEAYGLARPELEPFTFTAWRRGAPARLMMTAPLSRELPCYMLPYGAATGPDGIRAEVLHAGGGSIEELDALSDRIQGRLVLTHGGGGHRLDIYTRCVERGAAGFLISNGVPGMILHTGSVGDGEPGAIPAVSVSYETGLQIQRMSGSAPVVCHLTTDGRCEPSTSWNVVGELAGQERPEELVIMGGHLDSHEPGPGAFDNAAGAVAVMEAARLLARHRRHLKRTVRFIGFGAEEVGLLGSRHHAEAHAAELRLARWMLNCDMPALAGPRGLVFHNGPQAEPYVAALGARMGVEIPFRARPQRHSDAYSFARQGVLTAAVTGGPPAVPVQRFPHMAGDTPDKIPVMELRDTAAFAARLLLRAANGRICDSVCFLPPTALAAVEADVGRGDKTYPSQLYSPPAQGRGDLAANAPTRRCARGQR